MDQVDRDLKEWAEQAPGLDARGRHVIWRLQIAAKYIEGAVASLDSAGGQLSTSGAKLLVYLSTLPAPGQASPTLLGKRLSLTSGTMTSLIDRLESFGYVARQPDPDDRRGVLVTLTPEGARSARRLQEEYHQFESDFLAPLDEQERDTLAHLLRKLLRASETAPINSQRDEP